MYHPIENYAVIGNLRSAALVSKEGSIDWAPVPFIDSPTVFASILDDKKGGFWSIQPRGKFSSTQRYMENTNVLVTEFTTDKGVLEVIDFFPIEEEKGFVPAEENTSFRIHRKVRCVEGRCNARIIFEPRFNYAKGGDKLTLGTGGVYAENGNKNGVLVSKIPMEIEEDRAVGEIELTEGEAEFLMFRYNVGEIVFYERDTQHHEAELQQTISYWQNWTHMCDLDVCPANCKWHEIVARSALALKILFFEPVGTVAAAATTSLPEEIGGVRNWDYRLTWLRDSSFIFQSLFKLGHITEAEGYIDWFVETCLRDFKEGEKGKLQVVYGLRGQKETEEKILTYLSGYKNSQPVRIGNDAHKQRGMDIYGSVFDMIWQLHLNKGEEAIDEQTWQVLRALANFVAGNWNEPGEGLWEVRGAKQHFVYSKVMCWVALDRALKLADEYGFDGDVELWWNERKAIELEVNSRGWNEELGSFTQVFDSSEVDAAALLFPVVGFIKGDDPKMISTIRAVQKHLGCGKGLLKRYTSDDGLPGEEGAFLLASFWLIQALAEAGEIKEAQEIFDEVISNSNHVGLFPEEIDPKKGNFLGNFPQAYTHVGLINSAFALTKALGGEQSSNKFSEI